mmetsp:Transcript_70194/g.159346  ORF Transcript_70194/g.159346 Transcript_70194/m.159346 type:complete len:122 (-) Transcript_70194:187-552(-)
MQLKQKKSRKGKKGGGEGGEKGEKAAKGEKAEKVEKKDLPRERVTVMPVSGEVVEWKGKFGWLSSSETIEHEKAGKSGGKIFIHEKDIIAGENLKKGQPVEFHVYADARGLGAEEVIALSS